MTDQRAAFEAWALKYVNNTHFQRDADDRYIMYYIDRQWLAWKAAIEYAKETMCDRN